MIFDAVKRSKEEAEEARGGDSSLCEGDEEAPFLCLSFSLSILPGDSWIVALTPCLIFPIILFPFGNFNL